MNAKKLHIVTTNGSHYYIDVASANIYIVDGIIYIDTNCMLSFTASAEAIAQLQRYLALCSYSPITGMQERYLHLTGVDRLEPLTEFGLHFEQHEEDRNESRRED